MKIRWVRNEGPARVEVSCKGVDTVITDGLRLSLSTREVIALVRQELDLSETEIMRLPISVAVYH